ncbi:MAG TPA: methyltransferase domain-containing protein, partial [Planctomycetes bacterium]|nr:methyltransferase domain-containing protein [Planctomycetota bacterium]
EAGHRVVNLDLDAETAKRLGEMGVDGRQGELKDFSGGPFRIAIASEVLEHIPTDDLAPSVERVHSALEENGLFLVTVPFREDLARSTTICPHCGETHHLWGHRQSFDDQRLRSLFHDAGFRDVKIGARFFANYAQLNWGGRATFLMKHAAWSLFQRPSSSLKYVVEARK